MMKFNSKTVAKVVLARLPQLADLMIRRDPSGYFYASASAKDADATPYLAIPSVYVYSLDQMTFEEWVDTWIEQIQHAFDRVGTKLTVVGKLAAMNDRQFETHMRALGIRGMAAARLSAKRRSEIKAATCVAVATARKAQP